MRKMYELFSISTKVETSARKTLRAVCAWRHVTAWKRPDELGVCRCLPSGLSCSRISPIRCVCIHFCQMFTSNMSIGFQNEANCDTSGSL